MNRSELGLLHGTSAQIKIPFPFYLQCWDLRSKNCSKLLVKISVVVGGLITRDVDKA